MTYAMYLAVALLEALMVIPSLADTVKFTGETAGALPPEFELARTGDGGLGRWAVVRDETAEGGYALEQQSQDQNDYRFPLAIYKPQSARNVEAQIRFKAVTGRIDRAGGIALRLASPNEYYVVRANALENNVRFYRVVRGKREQLGTANVKVGSNEWHVLGLRAEGDRFLISFGGKELYSITDRTFGAAGKVALWTKADSVTRFDRLDIRELQ